MEGFIGIALVFSVLAILYAGVLFYKIKKIEKGNANVVEISGYIREGAMAFYQHSTKF